MQNVVMTAVQLNACFVLKCIVILMLLEHVSDRRISKCCPYEWHPASVILPNVVELNVAAPVILSVFEREIGV